MEQWLRRISSLAGAVNISSVAEAALAAPVVAAYEKRLGALQGLASWQEHYDRAVRFEGSGHHLSYGFERMAQWDTARLQGLSDPKFKVHHLIVKQTAGQTRSCRHALVSDCDACSGFDVWRGQRCSGGLVRGQSL